MSDAKQHAEHLAAAGAKNGVDTADIADIINQHRTCALPNTPIEKCPYCGRRTKEQGNKVTCPSCGCLTCA